MAKIIIRIIMAMAPKKCKNKAKKNLKIRPNLAIFTLFWRGWGGNN
jgi:DMSO/TMAO reductase YedYZ heme-binding membrane subunit